MKRIPRPLKALLTGVFTIVMAAPVPAAEVGGVTLPDTLSVGSDTLVLNGAGLRKKLFIKVYAGGLYLTETQGDAGEIIAADRPMAVRMHFIYDGVSSKKLVDAWNEGFDNATGGNIAPLKDRIDAFNAFFSEEAKKGDVYDIVYRPGTGVTVTMKGKQMGTVAGLDFKQALFAIWLGDKPADKGLKKGMLNN